MIRSKVEDLTSIGMIFWMGRLNRRVLPFSVLQIFIMAARVTPSAPFINCSIFVNFQKQRLVKRP